MFPQLKDQILYRLHPPWRRVQRQCWLGWSTQRHTSTPRPYLHLCCLEVTFFKQVGCYWWINSKNFDIIFPLLLLIILRHSRKNYKWKEEQEAIKIKYSGSLTFENRPESQWYHGSDLTCLICQKSFVDFTYYCTHIRYLLNLHA